MSTQKILTSTSKQENNEEKENKPAAVAKKFRMNETLLEQAINIMQEPIPTDSFRIPISCKIVRIHSCKAFPSSSMRLPHQPQTIPDLHSLSHISGKSELGLGQPKETKPQPIQLNQYQKEAYEHLKDKGLTSEHLSDQHWFNSSEHTKALIYLMTNTPTNHPTRAINYLKSESQEGIHWLVDQYEKEMASTPKFR